MSKRQLAIDVTELAGVAAVINGVRMWSVPTAWILAGVLAVLLAVLAGRGVSR